MSKHQPYDAIDFAQHYESLAQAWAEKLDQPFDTTGRPFELCLQLIEALWNVYPEIIESIEADPVAFSDRVALYRSNIHQSSTPEI
jgi:hypothetical protein